MLHDKVQLNKYFIALLHIIRVITILIFALATLFLIDHNGRQQMRYISQALQNFLLLKHTEKIAPILV